MTASYQPVPKNPLWSLIAAVVLAIVLSFALVFGVWAGWKSFHRYQVRADANNRVKVTAIEIRNQGQRVKVAQQKAQIRFENAKGVREAQDEIAKTLTPLYVQFEMVDALRAIAESGKNSTVVYVPSGANGIPLISGLAGQPAVTQPDGK